MSDTTSAVPNPGSDEAYQRGCKCARMDNAYGRGYMHQPGIFVYTAGCPLHWPKGQAEPNGFVVTTSPAIGEARDV